MNELRRWQAEALPIVVDALRQRKRAVVSAIMGAGKSRLAAELVAMAKPGDRVIIIATPTQALVRQLAGTMRRKLGDDAVGEFYADNKQPDRDVVVTCYPSLGALRERLTRPVALLIMDEVHKSEGERVKSEVRQLAATSAVGFTATPYRSLPRESLELWDEVVYRYTLGDALGDGVLVPMRRVVWDGQGSSDVDAVIARMIEEAEGPGIVSALSIKDAETYAGYLCDTGIKARAVHSRMHWEVREALLEELKAGKLKCLVHVSLLAEGVDLPWLRWIGLRRPVKARVRFIQELGRVLRCHPDKTEGVVLDPHDLLGMHGIPTTEAIGEALKRTVEPRDEEDEREAAGVKMTPAVAVDALLQGLWDVKLGLMAAGICRPKTISTRGWRTTDPSEKQLAALKKAGRLTRHMPKAARLLCRLLISRPYTMNRGTVSDLLDVLFSGARWAREQDDWREPYMRQWPADLVELSVDAQAVVDALKGVRQKELMG